MKILIVDDQEENRYLLEALLGGHGYEVLSVADGAQALDRLNAGSIDLIVSDILMPVMDGFELCRRVKADPNLHHIPFIVYTATYTGPQDEAFAVKIGVDRFIVKPCEPDLFLASVQEVMEKARPARKAPSPPATEEEVLKLYSQRLVRKLEQKMVQLENEVQLRKQAEAVLQESEQHFRNLADAGRALIYTLGPDRRAEFFNQPWLSFRGCTLEQELGEGWTAGMHPEDLQGVLKKATHAFDRRESFSVVYRLRRHDGQYRWIQDDGTPRYDSSGQFIGYIGHCLDISETIRHQERIAHLNNVLRSIQDVNQLIIRERNMDSLIQGACRLIRDNLGYAGTLLLITDEKDRCVAWAQAGMDCHAEAVQAALGSGELPPCFGRGEPHEMVLNRPDPDGYCRRCPLALCWPDSTSLTLRLIDGDVSIGFLCAILQPGAIVDSEEKRLLVEMADDIAYALHMLQMDQTRQKIEVEHRRLQEQMIQSQKLESVGRLAGGVAHDYNNMLTVILGQTELAMEQTAPDNPLLDGLKEIYHAALRSKEITRQLLAFARKQMIAPMVLDLNEVVESMLKMLRRLIGEDIDLAWLPGKNLWSVKVDPTQLDQVLANLCVNARDAIDGVGKVTIESRNIVLDENYCANRPGFVPGEFVLLAVSDDGCGMDKAVLDNIFEPFFTTKAVDQGTGLGLSTVYGIVKQNNGFINVYSEPGKGTTIHVYLPRHAGEGEETQTDIGPAAPPGAGETILVVEDEPVIMKVGRAMLERLGYRVLAASSPGQAIALAQAHDGDIDLVLTDVVMPEMNGRELAQRLQALHPGTRTVFMSGYTADAITHRGVLDDGIRFIQKPFSLHDLATKIRLALDS